MNWQCSKSPAAAVFVPLAQNAGSAVLVVRSSLPPTEIAAALRHTLGDVQPGVPVTLRTWPEALEGVLYPARAAAFALGVMGLFAVMLAVTGIFGTAAHSVSRRVRELGIRMALGARAAQVVIAAVGRPTALLGVGSALGLLAGVFARRLLGQFVYQADPGNPAVLIGAVLTMALIGIAGAAFIWRGDEQIWLTLPASVLGCLIPLGFFCALGLVHQTRIASWLRNTLQLCVALPLGVPSITTRS